MKQPLSPSIIFLLSITPLTLAMDWEPPCGENGPPEKRRRCEANQTLDIFSAEDLFFMKLGRLHMLQEDEQVERTALAEAIERAMGATPCLKCPRCHNRFNNAIHRIMTRPCCQESLCEACTATTLCPDKKRPSEPNPCPLCQHCPQESEATLQLLNITIKRATLDEQVAPLGLVQRLLLTQSGLEPNDNHTCRASQSNLKKILRLIENALGRIERGRSPEMPLQFARDTVLEQLNPQAAVDTDGEEEPADGESLGSQDSEEEEMDNEGVEENSAYEDSFINDEVEEEEGESEEDSERLSFIDDEEA